MQKYRVLESELVPVYETSTGDKVVYASELYYVLDVKSRFNDWVRIRLNDCDAKENEEYQSFTKKIVKGGRPQKDYIIKLDTAKEISMLERNEKGKQVRRYFIEVEKKYKKQQELLHTGYNSFSGDILGDIICNTLGINKGDCIRLTPEKFREGQRKMQEKRARTQDETAYPSI